MSFRRAACRERPARTFLGLRGSLSKLLLFVGWSRGRGRVARALALPHVYTESDHRAVEQQRSVPEMFYLALTRTIEYLRDASAYMAKRVALDSRPLSK